MIYFANPPVQIPDIGSIGFFFGGAVRSELEVTVPLNFTVGAKAKVDPSHLQRESY
jgi:hypothetical protein